MSDFINRVLNSKTPNMPNVDNALTIVAADLPMADKLAQIEQLYASASKTEKPYFADVHEALYASATSDEELALLAGNHGR